MPEAPAISSSLPARPEVDREIEELRGVIELSHGTGSFSVSVCNSVPLRRRLIERLRAAFSHLRQVTLPHGATDPFSEAARIIEAADGIGTPQAESLDAIMVDGFNLLDPATGPRSLAALNLSRELWHRRWPCAIVFWITQAELPALIRGAPDLWAWKSHLFEFKDESSRLTTDWNGPNDLFREVYSTIPKERRVDRRNELRFRLALPVTEGSLSEQSRRSVWSAEIGALSYALGEYASAEVEYERAAEYAALAGEPRLAGHHLRSAAFIAKERGDMEKARSLVHRAFPRAEEIEPADDPVFGNSYISAALDLRDLGDMAGAQARVEQGIAAWERRLGSDHPSLALYHVLLGQLLRNLNDFRGERAELERAIAIEEKHFGPDHPHLASLYTALALDLQQLGDLHGARAKIERALAIDQNQFGPEHLRVARDHDVFAGVLENLGDLQGAWGHWERAIDIWERQAVRDDPQLTSAYCNSALVLVKLNDYSRARARMEEAISIEEARKMPDFKELATCHHNLAWILAYCGDFKKALDQSVCAASIVRGQFDSTHPRVKQFVQDIPVFQRLAALPPEEAAQEWARLRGKAG
jgi:tetratricopeptide (TPR) repeat protein